jgi:hypothetical protein
VAVEKVTVISERKSSRTVDPLQLMLPALSIQVPPVAVLYAGEGETGGEIGYAA